MSCHELDYRSAHEQDVSERFRRNLKPSCSTSSQYRLMLVISQLAGHDTCDKKIVTDIQDSLLVLLGTDVKIRLAEAKHLYVYK